MTSNWVCRFCGQLNSGGACGRCERQRYTVSPPGYGYTPYLTKDRVSAAFRVILAELRDAEVKYPGWPISDYAGLAIIGAKLGAASAALLQSELEPLESGGPQVLYRELLQVAVTAIRQMAAMTQEYPRSPVLVCPQCCGAGKHPMYVRDKAVLLVINDQPCKRCAGLRFLPVDANKTVMEPCVLCHGTGVHVRGESRAICAACEGHGWVPQPDRWGTVPESTNPSEDEPGDGDEERGG